MLKCDGNYQNLYSVKQIYSLSLKVQREFNNRFICNVGKERGTGFVQWRHRRVQADDLDVFAEYSTSVIFLKKFPYFNIFVQKAINIKQMRYLSKIAYLMDKNKR